MTKPEVAKVLAMAVPEIANAIGPYLHDCWNLYGGLRPQTLFPDKVRSLLPT